MTFKYWEINNVINHTSEPVTASGQVVLAPISNVVWHFINKDNNESIILYLQLTWYIYSLFGSKYGLSSISPLHRIPYGRVFPQQLANNVVCTFCSCSAQALHSLSF